MEGEPNEKKPPILNIILLFTAFVPSVVAMLSLRTKNPGQWLAPPLLVLDVVCSFAAAIGLLRTMKNKSVQPILALALAVFFFFVNVLIVIFVGCSDMGRISP
jgi:protein-S-isoprenylcysteine O-methyltransferase Ste14